MVDKTIDRVIEHIENNISDNITIDLLADIANMSKFHFHKKFSEITGEKIMDYIKKRRLTEASFKLLDTNRPIIDIAMDYGYDTQQGFTKAFKKVFNTTPKKYRDFGYDNVPRLKTKLDNRKFSKDFDYRIEERDEIHLIGFSKIVGFNEDHILFDLYWKLYELLIYRQYPIKDIKVYDYIETLDYREDDNGDYKVVTRNFVGVEYVSDVDDIMDIDRVVVPKNRYAIFDFKGSSEHIPESIRLIFQEHLEEIKESPKDYSLLKVYDERVYGKFYNKKLKVKERYLNKNFTEHMKYLDRSKCLIFSHDYEFDFYIPLKQP